MFNENDKEIILGFIRYNIYEKLENKGIAKLVKKLYFLNKISNRIDRSNIIKYIKYIDNTYSDYMYAILFNNFDMDGIESGESNTLDDYKNIYIIDKTYYCTSTNTELFKILLKYISIIKINNIQNRDQNNLASNP